MADLKNTIASDSLYGLAKISNAADVTEENGIALSAIQNNASIDGTLAKKIQDIQIQLTNKVKVQGVKFSVPVLDSGAWTGDINVSCELIGYTAIGIVGINISGLYMVMKFFASAKNMTIRLFNPSASEEAAREGIAYVIYLKT